MGTHTINYVPHKSQKPFHVDRYKVKYRGLLGGTGSGKSIAGGFESLMWAIEQTGSVGTIFEPTYKMLKTITLPTLEHLLGESFESSPVVSNFNRTEMSLDFFNGSKIWMVSLDKPESAEGMNLDWAWIDEARLIPKFREALESVLRRLRGSKNSVPLDSSIPKDAVGMWITTTPDAPGSDLFNFFEDPDKRDKDSKSYRVSLLDNPHVDESFKESIKRAHTGGEYKRFVEGVFAGAEGTSFNFEYGVHVEGFKNIFQKENMRRWIYGVDFGWTNPSVILAIGFDGDGRAFVVDEVYEDQLSEKDLVKQGIEMQRKWEKSDFWCDSSEPKTISAFKRAGVNAHANKSKRDDGIREIGGRFEDAGDGRRRLYVSPDCVNLINELHFYDADKKENDHAVDALRYGIMGAKRVAGKIQVDSAWRQKRHWKHA